MNYNKLKLSLFCHAIIVFSAVSFSFSDNSEKPIKSDTIKEIPIESLFDEVKTFSEESAKTEANPKLQIRGKGIELQTRVNTRCLKAMMMEGEVIENLKEKCMEARKEIQDAVDNLN